MIFHWIIIKINQENLESIYEQIQSKLINKKKKLDNIIDDMFICFINHQILFNSLSLFSFLIFLKSLIFF